MAENQVSVVIPAHRAQDTLSRALFSLRDSGLKPSILVIEDGVLDSTSELLSSFPEVFHLVHPSPWGAAASRNHGLEHVTTPYVFFLDSDDLIRADHLESLYADISSQKTDICLGPWQFHNGLSPIGSVKYPRPIDNRTRVLEWIQNCCFPPCSVLWRTQSLRRLGGWNAQFSYNDDAELMLRAFMSDFSVSTTQLGCGFYVQHDSPTRLSRSKASIVDQANESLYVLVNQKLNDISGPDAQTALGFFCYEQARRQYRDGFKNRAHFWLTRSRAHGLYSHPGSLAHRLLVKFLGLSLKERIAGLRDSISWLRHHFD